MSTTVQDIRDATGEFFARHWNTDACSGIKPPQWSALWDFIGSMPNTGRQGCYAFLVGEEVKYIGSGVAKGSGIYRECGLGARTWHYMTWAKDKEPVDGERIYEMNKPYKNVTAVITIGFPSGYGYLALALEAYLISHFKEKGLVNVQSTT